MKRVKNAEKLKNATKRIVVVTVSALIVSSISFGVGLEDYPYNFVDNGVFQGQIVVGEDAQPIDTTAAMNIIEDLRDEFSGNFSRVRITYRESGVEGDVLDVSRSNTFLNYGESIGEVTETAGFDNQDIDILADERFDNDISDEDYEQTLTLLNGEFNYALRDEVDDVTEISNGIFYGNGEAFARYTLDMDSSIDLSGNDFDENLIGSELTIMGNEFTVGAVTKDNVDNLQSLELVGGSNKISLGEGESTSVTIENVSYDINVQSVSDNEVLLSINGQSQAIDEFDTEDVAGVNVAVTNLIPSSRDVVQGFAELVIGGQKITLDETGIEINDEELDDIYPEYDVETSFNGTGLETITITYRVDDDVLLEEGDYLEDILFQAFRIEFDGINDPVYTSIDVRVNDDDISIDGTTEDGEDFNQDFLHMGDQDSDTTAVWISGDQNTDRYFYSDSQDLTTANGTGPTIDTDGTSVSFDLSTTTPQGSGFLITEDNEEQYLYEINNVDTSPPDFETDFDELLRGEDETNVAIDEWDTELGVPITTTVSNESVSISLTQLGNIIAFENEMLMYLLPETETADLSGGPVILDFRLDSSDASADDAAEENDGVRLEFTRDAGDDEFDINSPIALNANSTSTFVNAGNADNIDDSSDTQTFVTGYGIRVEFDNDENTYATINIPEEQVYANVNLRFGSGAEEFTTIIDEAELEDRISELEDDGFEIVSTETLSSEEVEFDVEGVMLDSEVTGVSDMIVVGGPAINSAARELLGIDEYTIDQAGVLPGEGVINYYEDVNSILVYGYSGDDTLAAASRLNLGGLSGDEVLTG